MNQIAFSPFSSIKSEIRNFAVAEASPDRRVEMLLRCRANPELVTWARNRNGAIWAVITTSIGSVITFASGLVALRGLWLSPTITTASLPASGFFLVALMVTILAFRWEFNSPGQRLASAMEEAIPNPLKSLCAACIEWKSDNVRIPPEMDDMSKALGKMSEIQLDGFLLRLYQEPSADSVALLRLTASLQEHHAAYRQRIFRELLLDGEDREMLTRMVENLSSERVVKVARASVG